MLSAMTPVIAIRCRAANRSAVSPKQIATLIREGVRRIELGKQLVDPSVTHWKRLAPQSHG